MRLNTYVAAAALAGFGTADCTVDVPDLEKGVFRCASDDDCAEAYTCRAGTCQMYDGPHVGGCQMDGCATPGNACTHIDTGVLPACKSACRPEQGVAACGRDAACIQAPGYSPDGMPNPVFVCKPCAQGCAVGAACVEVDGPSRVSYATVGVTCGGSMAPMEILIAGRVEFDRACLYDAAGGAATMYVVLFDGTGDLRLGDGWTRSIPYEAPLSPQHFELGGVQSGSYALFAFVDSDGDGLPDFAADNTPEEPMGVFPLPGEGQPLQLEHFDADRTDVVINLRCDDAVLSYVACESHMSCASDERCVRADADGNSACAPYCDHSGLGMPCATTAGEGWCVDVQTYTGLSEPTCVPCVPGCTGASFCGLDPVVTEPSFYNLGQALGAVDCQAGFGTCSMPSDCGTDPTFPVCDTSQGLCVECLADSDCVAFDAPACVDYTYQNPTCMERCPLAGRVCGDISDLGWCVNVAGPTGGQNVCLHCAESCGTSLQCRVGDGASSQFESLWFAEQALGCFSILP